MDIRQLKYFLAIVENQSIIRAAEKLNMAQPPLSQQMKSLELELGVKLFERGSRKIQLTQVGSMLKIRAEQIVELMETTKTEIRDFKGGLDGTISIGTVASLGASYLPSNIKRFNNMYPNVKFQIWDGETYRILDLLKNNIVEIGIIRAPFDQDMFNSILLADEPMVIAVNEDYFSFNKKSKILLKDLSEVPLIIDRRFERKILDAFNCLNFTPNFICKSDDSRTILSLADAGIGIATVPKSAIGTFPCSKLKYMEIEDVSLETKPAIVWMKNKYVSPAVKHFLEVFTL